MPEGSAQAGTSAQWSTGTVKVRLFGQKVLGFTQTALIAQTLYARGFGTQSSLLCLALYYTSSGDVGIGHMKACERRKVKTGVVHEVPRDMRNALICDTRALERWNGLTPLARNEWICWTISVIKAENTSLLLARLPTPVKQSSLNLAACRWPVITWPTAQRFRYLTKMEIGEVFYPRERSEWRSWLEKNGSRATEIWVRRFRKASGIQCIAYDDLVEECLCFGWIDGIIKKLDEKSNVQRITPRKHKTFLSELNRQRIWKLEAMGVMTEAGRAPIADQIGSPDDTWEIPDWIERRLREDGSVWEAFSQFPFLYQRLKIGWITEAGQHRREEMDKRLAYLIKNTRAGKMYGTIPIGDEAVLDRLRSRPR